MFIAFNITISWLFDRQLLLRKGFDMKRNALKQSLVATLSFLTLLIFSSTTFALSTVTTSSSLNWEGLSFIVDGYDISTSIEWAEHEYSNLGAYASDDAAVSDFNSDGARVIDHGPWRTLDLSAVTDNATGTASTTTSYLSTQVSAFADGVATIDAAANADLHRTGDFMLYSAPIGGYEFYDEEIYGEYGYRLNLTIPYTMLIDSFGGNNWSYSLIELTLSKTTYVDSVGTTVEYGYDSISNLSSSGLLSISADLELGVFYSLNAHLYSAVEATENDPAPAPEPVPEPSTLLLLGSGLAGLAFYRRKKK
jgi:hypothetical protein